MLYGLKSEDGPHSVWTEAGPHAIRTACMRLGPSTISFIFQELVKEMVTADIQLLKKDPTA